MNFTLNILGTASALPVLNRFPSAQVLDVRGRLFLIDCGEGAQMQIRKMRLSYLRIDNICLSHLHGDHIFGLFGLLSTMAMLGRTSHLNIFAPKGFAPILKFYLSNFADGLRFSIEHHPLSMREPETVWSSRSLEMLAFPLNHRIDSYGFLIREKVPMLNVDKAAIARYDLTVAEIAALKRGEDVVRQAGDEVIPNAEVVYRPYVPRSYAYCSDTAPFPELPEWVKGVSLLYHEATFPEELASMAEKTFHSTARQAAECAAAAGVGRLVIGHYSSRYADTAIFLQEASEVFPKTELARECMTVEVPLVKLTV